MSLGAMTPWVASHRQACYEIHKIKFMLVFRADEFEPRVPFKLISQNDVNTYAYTERQR